jgi:hypothetical protein
LFCDFFGRFVYKLLKGVAGEFFPRHFGARWRRIVRDFADVGAYVLLAEVAMGAKDTEVFSGSVTDSTGWLICHSGFPISGIWGERG